MWEWIYRSIYSSQLWHQKDVRGQFNTPTALPQMKNPWYPLDRRLGELQN
jgi:hypothetical protein